MSIMESIRDNKGKYCLGKISGYTCMYEYKYTYKCSDSDSFSKKKKKNQIQWCVIALVVV